MIVKKNRKESIDVYEIDNIMIKKNNLEISMVRITRKLLKMLIIDPKKNNVISDVVL